MVAEAEPRAALIHIDQLLSNYRVDVHGNLTLTYGAHDPGGPLPWHACRAVLCFALENIYRTYCGGQSDFCIRTRVPEATVPHEGLLSVAEGVHHLFRKRGNNGAIMWLKALDMKTHLNEIRVPPALFRGLTAIGFAVLLVGLMFASKGGGV